MEGSSSIIIRVSPRILFFVLSLIVISCTSSGSAQAPPKTTTTEFIRTSCSQTTYPRLCYSSLSRHASFIQTSPKLLAGTALNVTLSSARSTSGKMLTLSKVPGMTPREVRAMRDCVDQLSESVYELRRSIAEMSHITRSSDFALIMNDVQTWVSAALTDDTTCSDGFAGKVMNGEAKTAVRGQIVTVAQLTSNALALINRYASLHS